MGITNEEFDEYLKKSFFTEKNFSGRYDPKTISNNMIPNDKLDEFHYQTSFFLNLYASLYIELKKFESSINYDITKFTKTIENLGIIIDSSKTIFKLSTLADNNYNFYFKTFESKTSNQNQLYDSGFLGSTIAYESAYSPILSNSKAYFGSSPDNLNISEGFKDNLSLTSSILKKNNLSILSNNNSKFNEIIKEILSQTPENILGYLLNKKIYYNIILFNISIQKSIRNNYFNYNDNINPITISSTNTKYISFTSSQKIDINKDINCDILIVAGGGAGGGGSTNYYSLGGGGGGGEVLYYTNKDTKKTGEKITLRKGEYTIEIGEGGNVSGANGMNSIIKYNDDVILEARGGGGGGDIYIGQGKCLGSCGGNSNRGGGGGVADGNGILIDITGKMKGYGGGGGAFKVDEDHLNIGNNGGGDGAIGITTYSTKNSRKNASPGIENTGGGGGAGLTQYYMDFNIVANRFFHFKSGNGGSGVIIISYEDNDVIIKKNGEIEGNKNKIITNITSNIINISELNKIHFIDNKNDYLLEKNNYINKINILNNIKSEFYKTQEKLNISIKLYNEQYKIYNLYKKKSIYIIIILIVIVVSILLISVFPLFSITTNNTIYIILLILLIILTYINFKKINLTENFEGSITKQKKNHIYLYNNLLPKINEYSNAYNDLLNNLRQNIYTNGSKSFSQDANIYLYNLYLEKNKLIESNNIKSIKLFNYIEIIKKHMNYLNNIILIISLFSIILLKSLIIYSIFSISYIFVIIILVIIITIIMIYFAFVIIQPTRMIANKKYWANVNPSSKIIKMI